MIKLSTFAEVLEHANNNNKKLFEVFQDQEASLQEKCISFVRSKLAESLDVMHSSIKQGLANKELSPTGIVGDDSNKIIKRYTNKEIKTPFGELYGNIMAYAIATLEENQRMGKVVACPTAGSCGIVPAALIAYSEKFDISQEKQIDALLTAAGIGKIISFKVALAGAIAGCQAECGVASTMAAGALTELMGGDNEKILNAAALALKNVLGLTCDPVAGLVEVPCIKRNGFSAIHSATASEMALAGIKSAIPLDEVVDAMKQAGILMSPLLKECSEAGLATTKTGMHITNNLNINK